MTHRGRSLHTHARLIASAALIVYTARGLAQVAPLQPGGGRDCAVCHTGWTESFRRPGAVLLLDKPPESYVSHSDNCLGCHDGSVGDSRRRVWVDHGHKTGIAPPQDMKVPHELPLSQGRVECRTCHTAHAGSGPETSLASVFFLRMKNDAGQLCIACHSDYVKAPAQGSHPLGEMKIALPQILQQAGAHAGAAGHSLNCQSCHTPHGQKEAHLLVLPAADRTLCLSCHQDLAPDLWASGRHHPHPQEAPISSEAQRRAIQDMHTRLGPDDTLICLSCHKMHDAMPGRNILADTLENSSLCLRCHAGQKLVMGSDHDLRKSAPEAVNLRGQTAQISGPCIACHGVHHASRTPAPAAPDPSGQCLTCHRPGECAQNKTGLPVSHPIEAPAGRLARDLGLRLFAGHTDESRRTLACLTCHNPHEPTHEPFLNAAHDTLCAACHVEQQHMAGGPHDFTARQDLKNARNQTATQAGNCGFCHGIHNASGAWLWTATAGPPQTPEALCTACHRADGLASAVPGTPLRHPHGPDVNSVAHASHHLPLYNADAQRKPEGFVSCGTCHDPHARPAQPELLRTAVGSSPQGLCMECHQNAEPLQASLHATDLLAKAGLAADTPTTCGPCHSVHEIAGMAPAGTWAGPTGAPADPPGMRECTGCHRSGGAAPIAHRTVHPAVLIQNIVPPGSPSFMPLFADDGQLGPSGQIVCVTCHLPHGRHDAAELIPPGEFTLPALRALRPMVRPYLAPNVCSNCHGADGLRRFLYYHWPEKRQAGK